MTTSVLVEDDHWLAIADVEGLAKRAVASVFTDMHCTVDVLLTTDQEIRILNNQFRQKNKATNVLSFPASLMPVPAGEIAHLGDIVLAYETVAAEAAVQNKTLADHVTHLVVHATLHLLGYDHETDAEAEVMEEKERVILAGLGIADPYAA
jgi:probable rRNA maturation factor